MHRYIKPENIVFDNMNNLRNIDFGLSVIMSHKELEETYETYFYASPEIHNKGKYNKATDIWSFGILLYYILICDFPFDRNNYETKLMIGDMPHELDFHKSLNYINASEQLQYLIKHCLKKIIINGLK